MMSTELNTIEHLSPEKEDDGEAHGDNQEDHVAELPTRDRRQSDAERRDAREDQRATRQQEKKRLSLLNSRFLTRKETKNSSPTRRSSSQLEADQEKPEDSKEPNSARSSDHALVVTRKRSQAAGSASSARARRGRQQSRLSTLASEVVIKPRLHPLPSWTLKSSAWTKELDDDAASGFYVHDERQQLTAIPSSTLVRLEERVRRENQSENPQSKENSNEEASRSKTPRKASGTQTHTRLNDLVHTSIHVSEPLPLSYEAERTEETRLSGSASQESIRASSFTIAALQIAIDRVVLDDHADFMLTDRLEAQLRSLYSSYWHLLQTQPWQTALLRLDASIERQVTQETAPLTNEWHDVMENDAERLLHDLATLQQLHYQLLGKWHELQDSYRQTYQATRPWRLRVEIVKRAESISLLPVHALLELLNSYRQRDNLTELLKTRLESLQAKDQCLNAVLILDVYELETGPSTNNSAARTQIHWSDRWNCLARRPDRPWTTKFYIALHINGHEAARTKVQSWRNNVKSPASKKHDVSHCTSGVIEFQELLQVRLLHFPESVSVRVYEKGVVVDTLLSTTAIPLLIPGDEVQHLSNSASALPAASFAPTSEWYQFSSIKAIPRSRWHTSFLNSTLLNNIKRRPHGRVRVQVAWVPHKSSNSTQENENGLRLDKLVVLPLHRALKPSGKEKHLVGPRINTRRKTDDRQPPKRGFSYEQDFLVHIDRLPMMSVDRKNPENLAVVRLQDHIQGKSSRKQQRDVFRTSTLAADACLGVSSAGTTTLSKRNYLLQLRNREHMAKHGASISYAMGIIDHRNESSQKDGNPLFYEPMPLLEEEITANERFLVFLRPEIPAFDRQERVTDANQGELYSTDRLRKTHLVKIQDFLDRVKATQLLKQHVIAPRERTKTLASIIQEQPLPLLPGAMDLSGLARLFARRRRLRPQAQKRIEPTTVAEWPRRCNLYIQIKHATNVPIRHRYNEKIERARKRSERIEVKETDDNDAEKRPEGEESHVFVELAFQGRRRRSTSVVVSAAGAANAVWMETFVVPFHPPLGDWSPESILRSQDVIRVSLFDQLVVGSSNSAGDDGWQVPPVDTNESRDEAVPNSQRIALFHHEHRFLGSLEVPFTTLYHNHGTLDATLRCEVPVVHLGYANAKEVGHTSDDNSSSALTSEKDEDGVLKSSREATFLSLMMTLDPLLPQPVKAFEDVLALPSTGDRSTVDFVKYAKDWMTTTHGTNPATRRRDFQVFVRNLTNGKTFITQYLTPQAPPSTLKVTSGEARVLSVQSIVRYVKLIPFLDDWHLFDGELDVWSTSQELLEINAGDYEEHAVLLCNYLQWLDRDEPSRRSYLVLGSAVPEGSTVYVLRQDAYKIPQRSVLWNASTGVGYSVLDDRCPMLDVSLVVSSDNVYANLQQVKRLVDLNWEIETNLKAWKPFFNATFKKEQASLPNIQLRELQYAETPSELVQQVESELRETLKLEIRRWRSTRFTTTFNIDLSMKLRTVLEDLERSAQGRQPRRGETETRDPMEQVIKTKDVSGMPLNITFTDISKVIMMVKNTHVHWNDHPDVEFALAVYAHGYPNGVLSVWVYLVSLVPR